MRSGRRLERKVSESESESESQETHVVVSLIGMWCSFSSQKSLTQVTGKWSPLPSTVLSPSCAI